MLLVEELAQRVQLALVLVHLGAAPRALGRVCLGAERVELAPARWRLGRLALEPGEMRTERGDLGVRRVRPHGRLDALRRAGERAGEYERQVRVAERRARRAHVALERLRRKAHGGVVRVPHGGVEALLLRARGAAELRAARLARSRVRRSVRLLAALHVPPPHGPSEVPLGERVAAERT